MKTFVKKITLPLGDFYEVKVKKEAETVNGDAVEILEKMGDYSLEELEGRKDYAESQIEFYQKDLAEVNEIINNISKLGVKK